LMELSEQSLRAVIELILASALVFAH